MEWMGTSLAVQWLRLHLPIHGGVGSIPDQGAKIPYGLWLKNHIIKQKKYCNKFNKVFKKKEREWRGPVGQSRRRWQKPLEVEPPTLSRCSQSTHRTWPNSAFFPKLHYPRSSEQVSASGIQLLQVNCPPRQTLPSLPNFLLCGPVRGTMWAPKFDG